MEKKYNPRFKIATLYGLLFFLMSGLVVRLVDTQLIKGSVFAQRADNNRMYRVYEPEKRGVFLDRYNDPLVYNKPIYYKLETAESLYSEQSRISREEALQTLIKNPDLIRIEHEREYLYPESLSHVLGYIGNVSGEELLADSSLHISDKIGKMGLEKEFQSYLKGTKGYQQFEINALGEKQHLVVQEPGVSGQAVTTTIDPYLAEVSLEAMGDKRGSVIILDAENGEVLSLVTTPTFNAVALSESTNSPETERERVAKIQSFFSHPQKLFFNRAVSGAYPPGSVFKLITALAGLEDNKITKDTTVIDEGVLQVGEYSYANWYYTQYGRIEGEIGLVQSLARSNDIFFYKAAEWVGPEKIKEMAQNFGLGEKTGIELSSETKGIIPDPEWKQRVVGERWFLGNTYHFGIGQGDLLASPIQIAQMTQSIANKGTLCSPTLITNEFTQGANRPDRCGEVGVLQENLELVVAGMLDACSSGGTGFPFFSHNAVYRNTDLSVYDQINAGAVACKTGTSEFGPADSSGYRDTHGWFVSIFGTQRLLSSALESATKEENLQLEEVKESSTEATTQTAAENNLNVLQTNKEKWLDRVKEHGFPKKIVIVVLVESDETNNFREGSKDAGPVAKFIFDWMFPDSLQATQNVVITEGLAE